MGTPVNTSNTKLFGDKIFKEKAARIKKNAKQKMPNTGLKHATNTAIKINSKADAHKLAPGAGLKFDASKLPVELFDWEFLEEITEILEGGAIKYEPNNWKKLEDGVTRYSAALARHFLAMQRGERLDPDTGKPHIWHIGCNAMFISYLERAQNKLALGR